VLGRCQVDQPEIVIRVATGRKFEHRQGRCIVFQRDQHRTLGRQHIRMTRRLFQRGLAGSACLLAPPGIRQSRRQVAADLEIARFQREIPPCEVDRLADAAAILRQRSEVCQCAPRVRRQFQRSAQCGLCLRQPPAGHQRQSQFVQRLRIIRRAFASPFQQPPGQREISQLTRQAAAQAKCPGMPSVSRQEAVVAGSCSRQFAGLMCLHRFGEQPVG